MDRHIVNYLPPVLNNVLELKTLMEAEQPEIDDLWAAQENVFNDQFVNSATLNGVQRWEGVLGIVPKVSFSLDERKYTILARLTEQLPFTIRMLYRMLMALCGADGFDIDLNEYVITVKVALKAKKNFEDVELLLRRVCPANLVVVVILKYNKHSTFAHYTHVQLAEYTHEYIRNEVMEQ